MTQPSKFRSPRYLGLDLAWAPRKSSGGAIMEADENGTLTVLSTVSLRTHEDLLSWVARSRGRHGCILAVNAPLIVENSGGQRPCDQALHEHFAANQLDEYHVNIANASHPRTISGALQRMGFDLDPTAEGDRVVETYNQPTQVLLFDLERPVKLKAGAVGTRKDAVARFRELLAEKLDDAVPPVNPSGALSALLEADLPASNGSRVGELEEQLEAVLCAYTAAYLHLRGPDACAYFGDLRDGYILLPTGRQVEPR